MFLAEILIPNWNFNFCLKIPLEQVQLTEVNINCATNMSALDI